MTIRKIGAMLTGVIFLVVALAALYRLIHYYPIQIAGIQVYNLPTFFVFVISAALCIIAFQGVRKDD